MTIPPFPSQDLAKLVLGYLAEEQLMTAYDEFLQASPYLDAHSNEYDRIFMTSLKNILAEYRAVRIYVETCKPHSLRRRLFGCPNLLEVVKFLIQNVDVTKLNVPQATTHKTSVDNSNVSVLSKSTSCEVCASLKLSVCACKSMQANQHSSQIDETTLESSVETTALEDLPGNQVTTKSKQTRSPEKDSQSHLSLSSCDQNVGLSLTQGSNVSLTANQQFVNNNSSQCQGVFTNKPVNESNHVMPDYSNLRLCGNNITETNKNDYSTSTAGSFQEFATGVNNDVANNQTCMNVPDSSTSENTNSVMPLNKEASFVNTDCNGTRLKEVSKAHIFLKVGTVSNGDSNNFINHNSSTPHSVLTKIQPLDQKVTILSDIKVDKTYANDSTDNMPPVLRNAATSTPVMQMQTIVINGTPVYKQDHQMGRSQNFSQDEIMSMPTIILVPTSAPTKVTSAIPFTSGVHTKNLNPPIIQPLNPAMFSTCTTSQSHNLNVNTIKTSQSIVSDNMSTVNTMIKADSNEPSVKILETKNATVPKDNFIDCPNRTTPHALPPARKSSSTPRRTSHIRVLDFTTPRRILQETINEQVCGNCNTPTETLISKSPNIHTIADSTADVSAKETGSVSNKTKNKSLKSNSTTPVFVKKSNWDEDLRAMAIANQNDVKPLPAKPKRNTKKKKDINSKDKDVEPPKSIKKKKPSNNVVSGAKAKGKRKSEPIEEVIEIIDDPPVPPVKPTINIISGSDWNTISPKVDDKQQNKSNSDETVDTPDMDRNSLQNVIGAKLNISELLETPYKQALYDIQMDTPKFIGLDLPDEPISDIKIMNIPTPLYLTTPKPVHTPSPYVSRRTDYSSGSSYYKPEDCILPDLSDPSTSSKEKTKDSNPKASVLNAQNNSKEKTQKPRESSRPVRKCTKNVSYYNSPNVNKAKDTDDTSKEGSTYSDFMNKLDKSAKKTKLKPRTKSDPKKVTSSTKKRKTPMKKGTANPFMKIKPRRLTPSKVGGKPKKPEPEARKRTSSKEKSDTPSVSSSTKSRRKSSTPRKLHCNKSFTSESSGHESPEMILNMDGKLTREPSATRVHDFNDEQSCLRWSDDDDQAEKSNQISVRVSPCNDVEDIGQIKEFIEKSSKQITEMFNEKEHSFHVDLVKRGFDLETAKRLERDLDTSDDAQTSENIKTHIIHIERTETDKVNLEASAQSDGTTTSNLHIAEEEDEEDVIELSMHECNEETENYIVCSHEETKNIPKRDMETLKEKFSMEVCLDEDEVIRLRATPFTLILDEEPRDKEMEAAVNSISNIEKLYTPMKDSIRAQCYDIFDSTLTSLDTPLKANSPRRKDVNITVTEYVLHVEEVEEEKVEVKQKVDSKKRKRAQSGHTSDDATESKRNKQEPHNLLNSIQNIDIETVLYKLHGP